MIILCTRCQAKFRVADEKIGPRGAKVRCSKCGNVFAVHRDAGTASPAPVPAPREAPAPPAGPGPSLELELEQRTGERARRAASPAPPVPPAAVRDDPFATLRAAPATDDPFAAPASRAAADPFAAAPDAGADADAGAALAEAAAAADPFASAVVPRGAAERPSVPVTDLGDLLGAAAGARPAADDAGPASFRALDAPAMPGFGDLDLGGGDAAPSGLELSGPPEAPALDESEPPPLPKRHRADPTLDAGPGFAAAPALEASLGAEPAFAAGPGFGLGEPAFGAEPGGLDLAPAGFGEPVVGAEPAAAAPPAAASRRPQAAAVETPPADDAPAPRGRRLRSVAVNAISLAALLVVALGLVVVWRGGGSVAEAARGLAARAGLVPAAEPQEAFSPVDVSSGLYDRANGPPVLFVRGAIVSRAGAPAGALRVVVELVRGQAVIVSGEALAGAVPTPEELHAIADAQDLARRAAGWARRAAAPVRPGDVVPFLVAIADFPSDLSGTKVRVRAEPAEGPPR